MFAGKAALLSCGPQRKVSPRTPRPRARGPPLFLPFWRPSCLTGAWGRRLEWRAGGKGGGRRLCCSGRGGGKQEFGAKQELLLRPARQRAARPPCFPRDRVIACPWASGAVLRCRIWDRGAGRACSPAGDPCWAVGDGLLPTSSEGAGRARGAFPARSCVRRMFSAVPRVPRCGEGGRGPVQRVAGPPAGWPFFPPTGEAGPASVAALFPPALA